MPKRVNGQEGDLGTPVALEKKMRGTGEMASGRMATRSVTRALSNKGSQDPLSSSESDQLLHKSKEDSNVFADMTGSKKGSQAPLPSSESDQLLQKSKEDSKTRSKGVKLHWSTFTGDPYDVSEDPHDVCVQVLKKWYTKRRLKEAEMEFDKWVARHGRKYDSKKEREKRLLAFSENKRRIDACNKVDPGSWTHGYSLDNMDKFYWEN